MLSYRFYKKQKKLKIRDEWGNSKEISITIKLKA